MPGEIRYPRDIVVYERGGQLFRINEIRSQHDPLVCVLYVLYVRLYGTDRCAAAVTQTLSLSLVVILRQLRGKTLAEYGLPVLDVTVDPNDESVGGPYFDPVVLAERVEREEGGLTDYQRVVSAEVLQRLDNCESGVIFLQAPGVCGKTNLETAPGQDGDEEGEEEAKEALVFMLVGVRGHWKAPIGYFLTKGLTAGEQKQLLLLALFLLAERGITVLSVVMDGHGTNVGMFGLLGGSLREDELMEMKTSFRDPTTGKEVFMIVPSRWLQTISRGNLYVPSEWWMEVVEDFNTRFCGVMGSTADVAPGIVKRLVACVLAKAPELDERDVLLQFVNALQRRCKDTLNVQWFQQDGTPASRLPLLRRSALGEGSAGFCCSKGKVAPPFHPPPPPELAELFSANSPLHREFMTNIRRYNCALQLASMGCKEVLQRCNVYIQSLLPAKQMLDALPDQRCHIVMTEQRRPLTQHDSRSNLPACSEVAVLMPNESSIRGVRSSLEAGKKAGRAMGRVVLPASFTGGPRYMIAKPQDCLTYVHEFGGANFFVTMTCDPHWLEIADTIRRVHVKTAYDN
ncbi:DNA transposase THAP9 [Amphibalanus amphitrite]|uniref:DNA transposase THAP9 n=1 Tax=Amphibalanus amphitrite TaxID=1232801 RepID=A0A6A4VV62_AMPAM|nr:DNA transposase THAP9 [Amphibalanus amphitrite]